MRNLTIFLAFLSVGLAGAPARGADKPEAAQVAAAQVAAEAWLKVVDDSAYGASWDRAAKVFKEALTKQQWVQAVTAARAPLGGKLSRKLKSRDYKETLPGAPDGKYVVIRFETVFEHKAAAVETVTPMLDPDGIWRVSGYFIR